MSGATAKTEPNYEKQCQVCGQLPTVDVIEPGQEPYHTELCGPCHWGEADCIDPENW